MVRQRFAHAVEMAGVEEEMEKPLRTYGRAGSRRLTPFKQGYLDGIHGDIEMYQNYKGRRRHDYERGYCCGLYNAIVYRGR